MSMPYACIPDRDSSLVPPNKNDMNNELYYIVRTEDGEFVKVYAVCNTYSEPEYFCEFGFNGRRWRAYEVEVVEYPYYCGNTLCHRRTYKYLHEDIEIE